MTERDKPEFTIATRGLIAFDLRVRTGSSDCHSGMFGNAGLNAIHALIQCLQAILPRTAGRPSRSAGLLEPSAEEIADWGRLKPGAEVLADADRALRRAGCRGVLSAHRRRALGRDQRHPRADPQHNVYSARELRAALAPGRIRTRSPRRR